jgi:hypothetical protein
LDSGKPDIVLGRILADEYGSSVTDPLPDRILALLSQLDEMQETSDGEATSRSEHPRSEKPSRRLTHADV